ncbi:FAD-dependent oxidoreductase [Achromobacter sp. GG226]|uniref:NAD(P)/FAD-dependent oxidoreductase n=1 Tax=Verticiella alkaliphila TaxID=2779529 RepID=UPI001C0BF257|nr:FAD-dependent oxidoreductase [Verticiella sp. GG226]MBU4611104.1 FAD-dependent oxidoreductase [Verticiella sp. GG226]
MQKVVIVGGGHAAAQLCASLIEGSFAGKVTLVCEESSLPYHRPPLSKTFIKDPAAEPQLLRAESVYQEAGIDVRLGDAVTAIDRAARRVTLASGATLDYDALVLATGTRARKLPDVPEDTENLVYLRNTTDALRLRDALGAAPSVTVLGGGFIGLEIAATAGHLGKPVTVFEAAPRLLARAVSPEASAHVAETLREAGVTVRLGVTVDGFERDGHRICAVTVQGERHPVDLLVAGIGAIPETALAEAAGLACDNGVVVDDHMRTADPAIYAIGDCTSFPYARWGKTLRLESVQNANDQARTLASVLLGQPAPYGALPWFWSDQGALRLQIAGLAPPDTERVLRPGAKPGSFSVLHFAEGHLVCVESINAPIDHIAARKLLEQGKNPPREQLADPAVPLKSFL